MARPGTPMLMILDLAGDERYLARVAAVQGAGLRGSSVPLDRAGGDQYASSGV